MKLQTKFSLGIIAIFVLLAALMAVLSVSFVNNNTMLNGATEKVDTIRDAVFANEIYNGKPVGTATIFLDDLRISTNVLDSQGRRAVGTRASKEVADRVLKEGLPWTGRAIVVDTPYLAQYDPIRDPDGKVIGMLYVGELEQKYLDLRTQAVAQNLGVILAGMVVAFIGSIVLVSGIVQPIRTLGKKGTGLGLYICKEIVEKHGGQIWADSKMGEWVKFSFTLPNGSDHEGS